MYIYTHINIYILTYVNFIRILQICFLSSKNNQNCFYLERQQQVKIVENSVITIHIMNKAEPINFRMNNEVENFGNVKKSSQFAVVGVFIDRV